MRIALSNTNEYAEVCDIDSDVEKFSWSLDLDGNIISKQIDLLANIVLQRVLGHPLSDTDVIKHLNHNLNNNTRDNLELLAQKTINQGLEPIPLVTFLKSGQQWVAKIEDADNNIYLGPYNNVDDAANAYNKWVGDTIVAIKMLLDKKNIIQVSFVDANLLDEPWRFKISGSSGEIERFIDIKMARLIMQRKLDRIIQPNELVKHIDKNLLNVHRENLELMTWSQLQQGKKLSTNTSGYIGVSWVEHSGMWRAQIGYQGKKYHLGLYPTNTEAAFAYDEKALKLFGPNAKLNRTAEE